METPNIRLTPLACAFVIHTAAIAGCGARVEIDEGEHEPAATSGGGGTTPETGGAGGTIDDAPLSFCEDACATTTDDACFSRDECATACAAGAAEWTPPIRDAFVHCAANDPLCFITLEGCMLGALGPEGRLVRLLGFGHEAHEGKTITVESAAGDIHGTATIERGSFFFEWVQTVETFDQSGPLLLAYIDVDGDGTCTPAADLTASEYAIWNQSFDHVEYELTLNAPLPDPDFVCDTFAP